MTLGTVATALGYPFFIAILAAWLWNGSLLWTTHSVDAFWSALGVVLVIAGFVAIVAPAFTGLRRRGWLRRLWPFIALLPFYFALTTVAAWRGLFEMTFAPFRWNKTEHGLARTSRAGLPRANARGPGPPRPARDSG